MDGKRRVPCGEAGAVLTLRTQNGQQGEPMNLSEANAAIRAQATQAKSS